MKKSEFLPILSGVALVAAAIVAISIKTLPVMRIDAVRTESVTMTPGIRRILSRSIGLCYPSISKISIINELDSLPYIASPSLSYSGGELVLSAEPVSGTILMNENSAVFFYDGEISRISAEDAASLSVFIRLLHCRRLWMYMEGWELSFQKSPQSFHPFPPLA